MLGNEYNWLERALHWVALQPTAVRELSFELEGRYSGGDSHAIGSRADGAVYICGLARSGTTILLRALARVDVFRSLRYRDMPFVLAPNLWRKVAGHARSRPASERAHGDGIMVDYDSPEAFEEVFWRTFCPQPADRHLYGAVQPTDDALAAFALYRAMVANPIRPGVTPATPRRYLSKNNNNICRVESLVRDRTCRVLVVFRDPIEAARSLLEQHQRFCSVHGTAPFVRTYMRWLGHHEFGLDHVPFAFARPGMQPGLDSTTPDYWLDYWTAVHRVLLTQAGGNVSLVDHDALCADPVSALASMLDLIGVDADAAAISAEIEPPATGRPPPTEFSAALVDEARLVHRALRARAVAS
jgi:hypothetical protein